MTNTRMANRSGRSLVLIHIENLLATAVPTMREVNLAVDTLRLFVPVYDDSQRIVACSHHAAPTVAFSFAPARQLWRSVPDGADLALLDVLENERVDERFDHVTICSGDGIFAPAAAQLAAAGVSVTVVSLQGHLSARLHLAACHVVFLPMAASVDAAGSAS
jgi:hypothetical protein